MARDRSSSFVKPVAGGTIGRTDQGVDVSGTPGAAVVDPVPGVSQYVGTIGNWFKGQPLQWFKVLTGKFKGRYWYGAEQIDFSTGRGSRVSQGQRIGTIARSGTGTEFGWATASGQTLAKATTGYTEGQVTPAGADFATRVKSATATQTSLGNIPAYVPKAWRAWVGTAATNTGLPPGVVAAQINDESGFRLKVTSSAGAEGPAQFLPSTFKTYGPKGGSPFSKKDSLIAYSNYMGSLLKQYNGNIRNALAAYNAGPANIAAGYSYADTILAKAGVPRTAKAGSPSSYGGTRPGGQSQGSDSGDAVNKVFADYEAEVNLPRTAPTSTFSGTGWTAPFQWWWQSYSGQYAKEQGG